MIVLIAGLSILVSYLIARATPLGSEASETVKVRVADEVTAGLTPVDATMFPQSGINPAVDIYIDDKQVPVVTSDDKVNGES